MTDMQTPNLEGDGGPSEEIPSVPTRSTRRDEDGVLCKGAELSIGCQPGIWGDFFVVPTSKMRRGNPRYVTTYPSRDDGWKRAWIAFAAGDPAGAALYRGQEPERRRDQLAVLDKEAARKRKDELEAPKRAAEQAIRNLPNSAFAVVANCSLVTGYGVEDLRPHHDVTLYFMIDRVEVVAPQMDQRRTIPLAKVLALQVDGPGAQTTGGGFIGGGFGITGAAEGMLMAAALNAITRRTTVQSFIEIHELGRHALWVTDQTTPQQLSILLRPVQARLRELRLAHDSPHTDPLDRLTKLAALRESGALTAEEFNAAKVQLLAALGEA